MKLNQKLFKEKMKGIASNLKSINHTDNAALDIFTLLPTSGNAATKKIQVEEFLKKQRSKLQLPHMLVEQYDSDYINNDGDNMQKQYNCAFIILDKFSVATTGTTLEEVQQKTEDIADDIISFINEEYIYQMQQGNLDKCLLIDFDKTTGENIGPIGDLYGTRINLVFTYPYQDQLQYHPAKWITPLYR